MTRRQWLEMVGLAILMLATLALLTYAQVTG